MRKFIDLSGQRFGKLVAINKVLRPELVKATFWKCKCDCGNETICESKSLRKGRSKSCGCNTNQQKILKFKKENPNCTEIEILKFRLESNCIVNGDCIDCTYKGKSQSGYPLIKFRKSTIGAHRASWMINYGEIPKDVWVMHTCDRPVCVNPKHLILGTPLDNTNDMIKKNRQNFKGCLKHSDEVVQKAIELKRNGRTYKEIEKELNIPWGSVNSFFRRKDKDVSDFYNVKKYSDEVVEKAYKMRASKIPRKQIMKELNIPKSTLRHLYKRYEKKLNHVEE